MNSKPIILTVLAIRAIVALVIIMIVLVILAPFIIFAAIIEISSRPEPKKSLKQIMEDFHERENGET